MKHIKDFSNIKENFDELANMFYFVRDIPYNEKYGHLEFLRSLSLSTEQY